MPKATRPHHARHRKYACLHGHIYPLLFQPAHYIGEHGTDVCKAYSLAEFFVCVLLMIGVQPSTCTNKTIIGADVAIALKVYIQVNQVGAIIFCLLWHLFTDVQGNFELACMKTYMLIICAETPLPTGGMHTACLDSWTGFSKGELGAPLWIVDVHAQPFRLLLFCQTLGWMHMIVSVIDSRPLHCSSDVWSRFVTFIKNVQVGAICWLLRQMRSWHQPLQEAYRPSPPHTFGFGWQCPCLRPRRPYAEVDKLTDMFLKLCLSNKSDGHV